MFNNELWQKPAGGAAGGGIYSYQIANSLRLNGTSQALEKTWGSAASDDNKKALSFWIKRTGASNTNSAIGSTTNTKLVSTNNFSQLEMNTGNPAGTSDQFHVHWSSNKNVLLAKWRDVSAWMHIVWIWNSDESTAVDRLKTYINGVKQTIDTTYWNIVSGNGYPNSGQASEYGKNGNEMHIARYQYDDAGWWGGQMADWIMIDGAASISDFGETHNGVWRPKDPSGLTFGNNGFWLKFTNASNPGEDFSGNNNDFSNIGSIATHDQMLDSPTFNSSSNGGNFMTYNPLNKGSYTDLSEGNLKADSNTGADASYPTCTFGVNSGKWYVEHLIKTVSGNFPQTTLADFGGNNYNTSKGIFYAMRYHPSNGCEQGSGTNVANFGTITVTNTSVATLSSGDIVSWYIDMDNKKAWIAKNGSIPNSGDPANGTNPQFSWTENPINSVTVGSVQYQTSDTILNAGQDGTFAGEKTAQGNSDDTGYGNFYYDPPTGFLALCSGNLSAAGADPAQEKQPVNNYFQAVTYTGTGANGRSLTTKLKAASFWGKNRTTGAATPTRWWNTTGNNFGTGAELYVQFDLAGYGASSSTYQGVSNPQDTSITIGNVGYINVGSSSYVAYLFGVAGAAVVTDTSGDIDSVRFTDADAGISIMDYTGSGTNGHTVPHGLGVKPSFVIIKNSTNSNSSAWRVWSDAFGDYNDYAVLDTDAIWQTSSGIFTADPTTTMLPLASGATQNNSSQTYMAWVFANTEGMVKAGTYVGNGNADSSFVYTGFKPAWVMVKNTSATEAWVVADNGRSPFNVVDEILKPNNNNPEATGSTYYCDFLSNGFKPRTTWEGWNQTNTFVYLAFAEMPFKYATAR